MSLSQGVNMAIRSLILFISGTLMTTMMTAVAECPKEYRDLNSSHTMCLTDKGRNIPLIASEISAIVDRHNHFRSQVNPKAASMMKLVWDNKLATVAAKWARQCRVSHDTYPTRAEPALPGVAIGQNAAGGYPDILTAVNDWAAEINDFSYGVKPTRVTGHYTQIVFDETARVGCGQADCSRVAGAQYPKVQICNYAIGQNGFNVDTAPYKKSTSSCSNCRGKCDSSGKLCDCGGKVCFNGGTLAAATCNCTCPRGYTGNLCQTKNCPGRDTSQCQSWMEGFSRQKVDGCIYDNVKKEVCPHRCGFCP